MTAQMQDSGADDLRLAEESLPAGDHQPGVPWALNRGRQVENSRNLDG
jgi:hypothetical protein